MRRRYIQIDGELIEVTNAPTPEQNPVAPTVFGDLPGYQSQTGLWVEGRAARREDLRRSGCRPWEGLEQEKKEAARQMAYDMAKHEKKLDEAAWTAWYQMDPKRRRILRGA